MLCECRQKKFSQAEIENKRSSKVALKPVRQTLLVWCGRKEVFKRRYVLITKEEGFLSRGFCLFDSGTEQRALQFLHIYCSDIRNHSSAPESNKQNSRDRTLDLSIFFRYKDIPSLKNLPSPEPNESSPYWFQGNFATSFVFSFCLREFLLSAFANRFELRCEPKRLMLLYYKICPCGL